VTTFIIEHQCPQCGAPAELEETDRIFQCGFCRVSSYLGVPDVFRYILPDRAPEGKDLIYFPYWRFKGMLFSCVPGDIKKRFLDVSQQAISSAAVPYSLGFRSQTQKLHFAVGDLKGRFIKPEFPKNAFINRLNEQFSANLPKPILHQAQIGETLSIIYAPFYIEDRLIDAVLNQPVPTGSADHIEPLLDRQVKPEWPIDFIPTICPQCGWDMQGRSDALTLTCGNCNTAWWAKDGKLSQLKTAYVEDPGGKTVYVPFWRIQADASGLQLDSYADLIRLANLPKVVQPGWEKQPFHFWSPAFKASPQRFLTFAAQVTGSQPQDELIPGNPKGDIQPVSMPLSEAVESLTLTLAGFVKPRQRIDEVLSKLTVTPRKFLLVYLPFQEGHHELIHQGMNLAISRNLLAHSKNM